jgi:hypothetical protein
MKTNPLASDRNEKKSKWRFQVEAEFVRDRSLSPESRLLYLMIQSHAGGKGELPFPGLNTLSRNMCRNRASVQKYLKELEGG